jgi:hypothetical protein
VGSKLLNLVQVIVIIFYHFIIIGNQCVNEQVTR